MDIFPPIFIHTHIYIYNNVPVGTFVAGPGEEGCNGS